MNKKNIFDEVDNIKSRVEQEILENQNLLKLLSIGHDNSLSKHDIAKPSSLVNKFIYFKPKTYSTVQGIQLKFSMTDYK